MYLYDDNKIAHENKFRSMQSFSDTHKLTFTELKNIKIGFIHRLDFVLYLD